MFDNSVDLLVWLCKNNKLINRFFQGRLIKFYLPEGDNKIIKKDPEKEIRPGLLY